MSIQSKQNAVLIVAGVVLLVIIAIVFVPKPVDPFYAAALRIEEKIEWVDVLFIGSIDEGFYVAVAGSPSPPADQMRFFEIIYNEVLPFLTDEIVVLSIYVTDFHEDIGEYHVLAILVLGSEHFGLDFSEVGWYVDYPEGKILSRDYIINSWIGR